MPRPGEAPPPARTRRVKLGRRIALGACVGVVAAMVGAAYAAVPLYRAFCQATGFDGSVRRAATARFTPIHRNLSVRFDTNVRALPWEFTPEVTRQSVQIGRAGLAYFRVKNDGATALTGRAVYNLTPESAAAYFIKTQCFCFNDQTIPAGKAVTFPVIYYVDPKFARDPNTRDFSEVTLSYTFYPATDVAAGKAGQGAKAPA